jgi:hypothetical protein
MGNYRLPFSQSIELTANTAVNMTVAANAVNKIVTVANLTTDFGSVSNKRSVMFKTFSIQFGPVYQSSSIASLTVPPVTVQVFAMDINGDLIQVTKQKMISTVNPITLRFRIPNWILGATPVTSTNQLLTIQYTVLETISASTTIIIPTSITAQADITPDTPQPF